MGLWDALRGRTTPVKPDLDQLFALPGAAVTLETELGLHATGIGGVCFRAAEGRAAAATQEEAVQLVTASGGPAVQAAQDEFGYTWLTLHGEPGVAGSAGLVTDLHAVNTTLVAEGFGPGLLCSLVGFADAQNAPAGLVYLFGRGAFYPFCPRSSRARDQILERQMEQVLTQDLRLEAEVGRRLPLWGVPGLSGPG